MDVVDNIAKVETGVKPDSSGQQMEDVPVAPITIKSAKRKSNP